MSELRVIALDLATTTGWALFKPGLERPHFGAVKLPGKAGDIGQRMEALRRFLNEKNKLHGPFTDVVFEAQHVSKNMTMDTVQMLVALGGMAEWFAYCIEARCFKVHISQWRQHFIGRGAGFKDQNPKELAIRKCAEFGWITEVADAAEAAGVLDYYLHLAAPSIPGFEIPWRNNNMFGGLLRGGSK